jgi:glucuronate isomerase
MLDDNFLLTNKYSEELFHNYAKDMPIIDYHCHLIPDEILENKNFSGISEAWLYADHYKWRLLRAAGYTEDFVTGNRSDKEKFDAFVNTLQKAPGNPIYEWSNLELKRYFNVEVPLNLKNADRVYEEVNAKIVTPEYAPRELLAKRNVKAVCTTDDPIDDLHQHDEIKKLETRFQVKPAWRPDNILHIELPEFIPYFSKLEVETFSDIVNWLSSRVEYFNSKGANVADHGFTHVWYSDYTEAELDTILKKAVAGDQLNEVEVAKWHTAIMFELQKLYTKYDWVSQWHISAFRSINSKRKLDVGINSGFDTIYDFNVANPLAKHLDKSASNGTLPKTVLYSLNPNDHLTLMTVMGAFQEGPTVQKLQYGSGWWFADTYSGMKAQLTNFAEQSLLGNFVGMLTDSRSFLSYTRHEYFRRILCDILGEKIKNGQLPDDLEFIGSIAKDISYNNVNNWFNFNIQ